MIHRNGPSKTVFVLGAGFSNEAGVPLQGDILGLVSSRSVKHSPKLVDILDKVFANRANPTLEDVFTLFDLSISQRQFCLGYTWSDLEFTRRSLVEQILCVIYEALDKMPKRVARFYESVAAHFLEMRVSAGLKEDSICILSLNWDSLLEDRFFAYLRKINGIGKADIDYCCYTTPLASSSPHTPSLLQKAQRIYNLKLIKLHGSSNWLLCPNCNRLYTGVGDDDEDWSRYVFPQNCPSCERVLSWASADSRNESTQYNNEGSDKKKPQFPILQPFIITPTFLKVFDNAHIQMSWHNAYVNLAEASEVVFIGYSFPEADFHVRTLLKRAISPDTDITVVLAPIDKIDKVIPSHLVRHYAPSRYDAFFGPGRVRFQYKGVKHFIRTRIGKKKDFDNKCDKVFNTLSQIDNPSNDIR